MTTIEERRWLNAQDHFTEATAEHEMHVLHHDGMYRHLMARRPDSNNYRYDLVTWPGHLAINGDLDSGYTFCRIEDMFEFFAGRTKDNKNTTIDLRYWAEKLTCRQTRVRVFSAARFKEAVEPMVVELGDQVGRTPEEGRREWADHITAYDIEHESSAIEALRMFSMGTQYLEPIDWPDFTVFDHSFLYSCLAIRKGANWWKENR